MADRSIKLVVRANVDDFRKQLALAATSVDDLAKKADQATAQTNTGKLVQSMTMQRDAWDAAGKAALTYSAAVGAVALASMKTAADFDQAMSNVQAATHESAQNMDALRDAALQAGADTAFSATEAAAGIENLAKAGVSTADILSGGLTGALDLAAAGELDVGEAAEISASALTQFGLSGQDVSHVADLLAAGAGKAQGSVQDMGMALNQAGLVAANTGASIEETTGTLAAFASAGLIGSDAGTSFKSMLQRLQNPSKESKKVLDEYNISMYDAQGNFVGMANLAGQLQGAFSTLTPQVRDAAFAQIFGSDAVRAANVLYQQGKDGIEEWTVAVDEAGFASETAALRQDNLKGDLEKLGGSIETLMIKLGEIGQGPARLFIQAVTAIVDTITELPTPVLAVISALAGITGVLGAAAGGFMLLAPRVYDTVVAIQSLKKLNLGGISKIFTGLKSAIGGLVSPVGLAAGAIGGVLLYALSKQAEASAQSKQRIEQLAQAYTETGNAASDAARKIVAESIVDSEAAANYKAMGGSLKDLTDAALGVPGAMEKVNATIDAYSSTVTVSTANARGASTAYAAMASGLRDSVESLKAENEEAIQKSKDMSEALGEQSDAAGQSAQSAQSAASAYQVQGGAAEETTDAVMELVEAEMKMAQINMSADEAAINYANTLQTVTEKLHAAAGASTTGTAAQRENQQSLIDLASAGWREIDALGKQGAAASTVRDRHASMTGQFIATAQQMGVNAREAVSLAQRYGLIPDDVDTSAFFDDAGAITDIQGLINKIKAIPKHSTSRHDHTNNTYNNIFTYQQNKVRTIHENQYRPSRASGGLITGPGTSTSDSIHAMVSNGEYVIRAASVAKFGTRLFDQLNAGILPRFADGGMVAATKLVPQPVYVTMPDTPTQARPPAGVQVSIGQVVNPVAEPATVTAMKQLQRMATLAGGLV